MQSSSFLKGKNMIFLVGFMGSGKTTLGKKIANKTDYAFIDLDELIVQKINKSISEYFELFGEAAFRKIEQETLHSLAKMNKVIVATGGGAPCHFDNMDWMNAHGKTIYLKMSAQALLSRLSQKEIESRPLLKGKSKKELLSFVETLLAERESFYSKAEMVYDALHSTPKDLLKQIVL